MKKLSENAEKFSPRIQELQKMLNKLNPDIKVNETGVWGDTDKGIREFIKYNSKRIKEAFPEIDDNDISTLNWVNISKKVIQNDPRYTPTVTGLTEFIKDQFLTFTSKTLSSSDRNISKITGRNEESIAFKTKDWAPTKLSNHFGGIDPKNDLAAFWSKSTSTLVSSIDNVYILTDKDWSQTGVSTGLYRLIYGIVNGAIRESKSFGTLLRERYWGRY